MANKNCSKCGTAFGCKNTEEGCWCEDLTLEPSTLSELRTKYNDCLCPSCLKDYASISTSVKDTTSTQE